jgi:hypothetical protein
MITLIVNPGQAVAIPIVVEHAGQVAVDAYVLQKTGVDLAARRAAQAAAAEAKRQAEAAAASPASVAVDTDDDAERIALALEAAKRAIPVNPPLDRDGGRRPRGPGT